MSTVAATTTTTQTIVRAKIGQKYGNEKTST